MRICRSSFTLTRNMTERCADLKIELHFFSHSFDFISLNLHSLAILAFSGRKHWLCERGSEIWRFMLISVSIVGDSYFSRVPALWAFLTDQYKPNSERNMNSFGHRLIWVSVFLEQFSLVYSFLFPLIPISWTTISPLVSCQPSLHMQAYHILKKQYPPLLLSSHNFTSFFFTLT